MNLVQVARLTKEEINRLTSDFRIVAEYLSYKDDEEKWDEFWKSEKEILHVEELLDVLLEISQDDHYLKLRDMIRHEGRRKEKWNMCRMAEALEKRGIEKGIQKGIEKGIETGRKEGISVMIQDNLEMGQAKDVILEKVMRFFSLTRESALEYYEMATVK